MERLPKQFPKRPSGVTNSTANPCVRNCCLDEQDVCLGCGRTLSEITGWSRLSEQERRKVLEASAARRDARRPW